MSSVCFIVQPIHPVAENLLRKAGLVPRLSTSENMEIVANEIIDAIAVITRSAGLSSRAMDAAPSLRVIASHGVGFNTINIDHATKLGIPVVNTPEANSVSVAEHTITLMLAAAKKIILSHDAGCRGDFDFKYSNNFVELSGKTLGIVGFGVIGKKVAAMANSAFAMNVLVSSKSVNPDEIKSFGYKAAPDLESLLREADFISLHRPLMANLKPLIGENELSLMKKSSILINTARGELLDEVALAKYLKSGMISGAALDVYTSEYMKIDHPILNAPNVILTPHVAGSTEEALKRTAEQAVERIISVLMGKPLDVVNTEVWDRRRLNQIF